MPPVLDGLFLFFNDSKYTSTDSQYKENVTDQNKTTIPDNGSC